MNIVADTWGALNITRAIFSTYFFRFLSLFLLSYHIMSCHIMSCHVMPFRLLYSTFLPTLTRNLLPWLLFLYFLLLPLLHSHTCRWWRWRCIQCVPVLRYYRRRIRCCTRKRRHHGTARSTCHATPSKVRNDSHWHHFSSFYSALYGVSQGRLWSKNERINSHCLFYFFFYSTFFFSHPPLHIPDFPILRVVITYFTDSISNCAVVWLCVCGCIDRLMKEENFEYLDNVIQMMSYFTYYSTGMYVQWMWHVKCSIV